MDKPTVLVPPKMLAAERFRSVAKCVYGVPCFHCGKSSGVVLRMRDTWNPCSLPRPLHYWCSEPYFSNRKTVTD